MTNKLQDFLANQNSMRMSIKRGLYMHNKMQFCDINSDSELVMRIKSVSGLDRMFDSLSRAEVPIAGNINGVFVSRRIDRLRIDNVAKVIYILDFKSDIDKNIRVSHYKKQLSEYKILLQEMYPDYKVNCSILWLHDWVLEQIL